MMRIEALKGGIKHYDPVDRVHIGLREGSQRSVREPLALYFIANGWAKDVSGKIEVQQQHPGAREISGHVARAIGLRPTLIDRLAKFLFGSWD